MARGLKFLIQKVEGLYCSCSENQGAVQLRSVREADLRLCFPICKNLVFSQQGSVYSSYFLHLNKHILDSFLHKTEAKLSADVFWHSVGILKIPLGDKYS